MASPSSSPATTASVYVRLSKEAGESNLSLSGMLSDLHAEAARRGLTVVGEHRDDGISGAVRDRPAFLKWLADGTEGRADVLLTWHADRLTREGVNAAALVLDTVEGKDPRTGKVVRTPVRLLDVHGLDSDDGDSFRLRFVIAAEIARGERARMVSRTRASRIRLAEAGRFGGGQAPYGFTSVPAADGKGRVLVHDAAEVAVLREAVSRVLDGETPFSIVKDLNARGIAPKRAKAWSSTTLRDLLSSEVLLGRVVGGRDSRETHRALTGEDGLPKTFWEPIVDPETFARLRVALDRTAHRNRGALGRKERARGSRLLSGLLRCAHCDAKMYVRSGGAKPATATREARPAVYSYVCSTPGTGQGSCPGVAVSCERIEQYVERTFLADVGHLPMYARSQDVTASEADLAAITRAISEATAAMGSDDADVPALVARLADLKAQRTALRETAPAAAPALVPTGETFAGAWATRNLAGRRTLLLDNVAVLTVSKGRKGLKGLDPARVVLVANPAQPIDGGGRGGLVPAI